MINKMNDPHLDMLRNKFFKESLLGIGIFGIPAFCALFLGNYLDKILHTNKVFTLVMLIIAFVSSWVVIYFRNKKITREYHEYRSLQNKMPDAKVQTNIESPENSQVLENIIKDE